MTIKMIAAGLLFLISIATGIWLSKTGRPLNAWLFNIHKLISLATVILAGLAIYELSKTVAMDVKVVVIIVSLVIVFLIVFITGALLSFEKPQPGFVLILHKIFPVVILIFSIALGYLFKQKI